MAPRTIDDCLKAQTPSLAKIRSDFGDKGNLILMAVLNVMVSDLVTFFNLGKNMNDEQVKITVQLIIEDYWYLKPEDFKYCFSQAKRGVYGKQYDRLDGQVILSWLEQYSNARADQADAISYRQHDQIKYGQELQNRGRADQYRQDNEQYTEQLRQHMVNNLNKQ
ncbi:DUF6633 family protein [Pedobacter sp. SYP-B3415]|uniref:DUF6633 family protein n=1 Tax=Pedobacter sp. SYP-B3415 TaxID=2496641 RepID=UPI00101DC3E8|nr:DUF6633 family protein [Pedobacter sp. SYP-B3415]